MRVTTKEAAKHFGWSPRTMERWRATHKGPPYYKEENGRKVCYYKIEEVEAWRKMIMASSLWILEYPALLKQKKASQK